MKVKDIANKCVFCFQDTSFGSGRFVNRIPAGTDDYDGYACAECLEIECGRCGDMIGLDMDFQINDNKVHWECLTNKEQKEIN